MSKKKRQQQKSDTPKADKQIKKLVKVGVRSSLAKLKRDNEQALVCTEPTAKHDKKRKKSDKKKQLKKLEKLGFEPIAFTKGNKRIEYANGYWLATPGGIFETFDEAMHALKKTDVSNLKRVNLSTTQAFVSKSGQVFDIYGKPARVVSRNGSKRRFVDLVAISQNGGRTISRYAVHKVVAAAYCNHTVNSGMEVHHIDCDCTNNDSKNLAVLTPEEHKQVHDAIENAVSDARASIETSPRVAESKIVESAGIAGDKSQAAKTPNVAKNKPNATDAANAPSAPSAPSMPSAQSNAGNVKVIQGKDSEATTGDLKQVKGDLPRKTSAKGVARPAAMEKLPKGLNDSLEVLFDDASAFGIDYAIKRNQNHVLKLLKNNGSPAFALDRAEELQDAIRLVFRRLAELNDEGLNTKRLDDLTLKVRRAYVASMTRLAYRGQAEAIGAAEMLKSEAEKPYATWKDTAAMYRQAAGNIEKSAGL